MRALSKPWCLNRLADLPLTIRPVAQHDRAQWYDLWRGYQAFYKVDLTVAVTDATWTRFFDETEPVHALVCADGDNLLGLVHYIFHRNTWMVEPVCYLQDLFTSGAARGRGVGRGLIEAVYEAAAAKHCSRVYWNTHESNAQAMLLYDKIATQSGFLQYRKQL